MKKSLKYILLFLGLIYLNISTTYATTAYLNYPDHEGWVTAYCSQYPGYDSISLTVNGVTDWITCDITPPSGYIYSYSPIGWTNGNVLVAVVCADGQSGCQQGTWYYRWVLNNGSSYIPITDNAGNTTNIWYNITNIDKTPPSLGLWSYTPSTWTSGNVTVTAGCWDGQSGCNKASYTATVSTNTNSYITGYDNVWNPGYVWYNVTNIDKTNPNLAVWSVTPSTWTNGNVTVTAGCWDGQSGCNQGSYPVTVSNNGPLTITGYDNVWNPGSVGYTVSNIDKTSPTVPTLTCTNFSNNIWKNAGTTTCNISDTTGPSPRNKVEYSKDGGNTWLDNSNSLSYTFTPSEGVTNFKMRISDTGGNNVSNIYVIKKDISSPSLTINMPNSKIADNNNIVLDIAGLDNSGVLSTDPLNNCTDCTLSGTINITGPSVIPSISFSNQAGNNTSLSKTVSITKSGTYNINVTVTDKAGNSFTTTNKQITIYPNFVDTSNPNTNLTLVSSLGSIGSKFANFSDEYTYLVTLKDKFNNPIYSKNIAPNQNGILTIKTDMVNNSGTGALKEYEIIGILTNSNGEQNFTLRSLAPGRFTQRFEIKMKEWGDDYVNNGIDQIFNLGINTDNSFKKPYFGELKVSDDDGNTWNAKTKIGSSMKYALDIIGNLPLINGNYELDDLIINVFKSKIISLNPYLIVENIKNITSLKLSDSNNRVEFDARINNQSGSTSLQTSYSLGFEGTNLPIISYNLGGENIKYYLSANNIGNDRSTIEIFNDNFIGVNIKGTKQTSSKSRTSITGQGSNFSDLSKVDMRTDIRKNAFVFGKSLKGLIVDNTVNNVRYVRGKNITISGNISNYETLVVENGNVTISGDLVGNGKPLGIIVLKDSYNVLTDYNLSGNVYINKDVANINAIIYADGGIISTNSSGTPYTEDSPYRTSSLNKPLTIKGSIFTRNTIGGAILSTDGYLLPGSIKTTDFDNAMIYDLNYLRTGKTTTLPYKSTFNIEYDPKITTNPPKLFVK